MVAEGGYETEQGSRSGPVYATPDDGEAEYSDYNGMQGGGAGAGAANTATGEYKMLHPVHATNELLYADQEALGRDRKNTV